MRRPILVAFVLALSWTSLVAQEDWRRFGGWDRRWPARVPNAESYDGGFTFCRLMFQQQRREPSGSGWRTDYPGADLNFPVRLGELTKTRVSRQANGDPNHLVVRATDDFLFLCPIVIMSDAGTVFFTDEEAERLRQYLLKGGMLWADDFWGSRAWLVWEAEIGKVLPPDTYPIRDIASDHPINRTLFEVVDLPQIPNIGFWRRSGGDTSERGPDSPIPHFRAIADAKGRLMVVMTHDTDIQDAWEREGEDPEFFYQFSPQGYAVGLNIVLHALTH
ncbi:MAG: DUF4159 domain-containing protein [Acidobacteriota bacterium]